MTALTRDAQNAEDAGGVVLSSRAARCGNFENVTHNPLLVRHVLANQPCGHRPQQTALSRT